MTSLNVNLIPAKNLRPATTRYKKGVKAPSLSMLKRGKQNKKLGDMAMRLRKKLAKKRKKEEESGTQ